MFAESRRRSLHLAGRIRELHGDSDVAQRPVLRMRELLHHLARVDVRILEHLADGVDRADRQLVLRQQLERFGARDLLHRGAENRAQLVVVADASRHRVEPRVEGELGEAERAAEILPLLFVRGPDVDEAVLRFERLVGNDRRMACAEPLGRRAGRQVAFRLIRERRDHPVQQRNVDALPIARAMPRQQRWQCSAAVVAVDGDIAQSTQRLQ